jgi:NAD(P)-dependent dehydrogenase (short-subunit alcohol dehydrogenase family)
MGIKNWKADDIPDLSGKRVIITGGNTGLGYETAKELARKNAEVIIACRNLIKGKEAVKRIKNEISNADLKVLQLDLADLASIREFASDYTKNYNSLHILINNAGIMMVPYGLTKDGFESQFGVNHLGHFALTGLLLGLIIKTPNSRVVNVSSLAHKPGKIDFSDLKYKNGKGYKRIKAYSRSKLANLLFTYELQRYFKDKNVDAIAVAAHPGTSETDLVRYIEKKFMFLLFKPFIKLFGQNAAMGALPQLRAAVDINVKGSEYYGPAGKRELSGAPVLVRSSEASHNLSDAKRLWEISEKLTGVKFPG